MNDDWSRQFKDLLNSPLGQELQRSLKEELHNTLIEAAEVAPTQENAYGLLKEASGVTKALAHMQFRAVTPRNEESSK